MGLTGLERTSCTSAADVKPGSQRGFSAAPLGVTVPKGEAQRYARIRTRPRLKGAIGVRSSSYWSSRAPCSKECPHPPASRTYAHGCQPDLHEEQPTVKAIDQGRGRGGPVAGAPEAVRRLRLRQAGPADLRRARAGKRSRATRGNLPTPSRSNQSVLRPVTAPPSVADTERGSGDG